MHTDWSKHQNRWLGSTWYSSTLTKNPKNQTKKLLPMHLKKKWERKLKVFRQIVALLKLYFDKFYGHGKYYCSIFGHIRFREKYWSISGGFKTLKIRQKLHTIYLEKLLRNVRIQTQFQMALTTFKIAAWSLKGGISRHPT